jgi:transposase-like protein
MKNKEKEKARELRKNGYSLSEICKELSVAKSSVSVWVRDIILTLEQKSELQERGGISENLRKASELRKDYFLKLRLKYQEEGRNLAKKNMPLHMCGCIMIWCEGGKLRNSIELTNSDIFMHKLFIKFLKKFYKVKNEEITISINAHDANGISIEDIENYWVTGLELKKENLRKTTLNRYSHFSQKKKIGKLPYGTCRLMVNRTDLIQNIYGAIQEYGQFERKEWVL